jgi:phosphoribosylanthranilate isomerase
MALITKIKAGCVSSLSDARYFAGMGVDWLGFNVDKGSEFYVAPDLCKDIAGWVSGPQRVAEISSLKGMVLEEVLEAYSPDAVQVPLAHAAALKPFGIPVFASAIINSFGTSPFKDIFDNIEYLVLNLKNENPFDHLELLANISKHTKILLAISPQVIDLKRIVTDLPIAGLDLMGSKELKAGLKEYDYSEVLEALEE